MASVVSASGSLSSGKNIAGLATKSRKSDVVADFMDPMIRKVGSNVDSCGGRGRGAGPPCQTMGG